MSTMKIILQYKDRIATFRMLSKYAEDPEKREAMLQHYKCLFAEKLAMPAKESGNIIADIAVISAKPCEPINYIVFRNEVGAEERIANLLPSALDDNARIERAKAILESQQHGNWHFVRFDA